MDLHGRASSEVFADPAPDAKVVKASNHLQPNLVAVDPHAGGVLWAADELPPEALFESAQLAALPVQSAAANLASYLQECEAAYITQALRSHRWQIGRTAAALGISRKNLWEKMGRHGIEPPKEVEPPGL